MRGEKLQDGESMRPKSKSLPTFFILVFILAIPFWVVEAVTGLYIPVINLPISAFVFVCPIIAALILVYRENGIPGVKQLLKRTFDFKGIRGKLWYLPIFLVMPAIIYAGYGLMKIMGRPVPDLQFPVGAVLSGFVVFFITALCEEAGWTGYATDPLQDRLGNALMASLLLGVIWATWHIVPWLPGHSAVFVAGQAANTVVKRVVIVWLYNNTGKSLFAAVSFHTMSNVSELVLFPVYGSDYDPVITFILMAIIAVVIVLLWGPKTLAQFRYSRIQD